MSERREKLQWALSIGIYHGSDFGHRIEMWTGPTAREPKVTDLGSWTGIGVPEQIITDASTIAHAALVEHLVTRYGVRGELPLEWGGGPDPF